MVNSKARIAFTNLIHLLCRHNISLSWNYRVCNITVSPVLPYSHETDPTEFKTSTVWLCLSACIALPLSGEKDLSAQPSLMGC